MKGTVTAKSGSTVKLRQKPSTECPIYWDIPVGTEMEIVDEQGSWSKCIYGGLTGWMKKEFVRRDCKNEDEENGGDMPAFSDPEETTGLLAEVYQELQDLCERILAVTGRG